MKKVLTLVLAVAFVASVSSCKKEYICDCTDNTLDQDFGKLNKDEKDAAEAACALLSLSNAFSGGSCQFKTK